MIRDIAIMLLVGGVVRSLSKRVNLLTVVGEIAAGLLIGPSLLHWVSITSGIEHVAEFGVMLLLFNAGMHVKLSELRKVGTTSLSVAIAGVVLPLISGFGIGRLFGESNNTSLFIGAALAATSIGITARVFSDLNQLHSVNARVVLGAAIADDVLGLIILAIASLMVHSGSFSYSNLLTTALVLGSFFGGVAVGSTRAHHQVSKSLTSFNQVFILLFFVSIGLRADVTDVFSENGIKLVVALSIVAFVSKYASGFVVRDPTVNRSIVGIGMVPRGEVGLIFANTAVSLSVFSSTVYSSVVVVVLVTTVIAPFLLRRSLH